MLWGILCWIAMHCIQLLPGSCKMPSNAGPNPSSRMGVSGARCAYYSGCQSQRYRNHPIATHVCFSPQVDALCTAARMAQWRHASVAGCPRCYSSCPLLSNTRVYLTALHFDRRQSRPGSTTYGCTVCGSIVFAAAPMPAPHGFSKD